MFSAAPTTASSRSRTAATASKSGWWCPAARPRGPASTPESASRASAGASSSQLATLPRSCAAQGRGKSRLLVSTGRARRAPGGGSGGAVPRTCTASCLPKARGEDLPLRGRRRLSCFPDRLFVFVRVPQERRRAFLPALRPLPAVLRVTAATGSYWWIDVFGRTRHREPLPAPGRLLHFLLVFPGPSKLHFAKPDEWTGAPPSRWKVKSGVSVASPALLYLLYAVPPFVFLYDVLRQGARGEGDRSSRSALSSWILLATTSCWASSPWSIRLHPSRTAGAPPGVHVFVGTIGGTVPSSFSSSSFPRHWDRRVRLLRNPPDDLIP